MIVGAALIAVCGCGAAPGNGYQPPTAPVAIDWAGTTGMTIAYDPGAREMHPTPEFYETFYRATRACVARVLGDDSYLTISGPLMRLTTAPIQVNGQTYGGWTDWGTGQITLFAMIDDEHEFVHYLLWRHGFPNDANSAHQSPAFAQCGPAP